MRLRGSISHPSCVLVVVWLLAGLSIPKCGAYGRSRGQNPAANLSGTVEDETGAAIAESDISVISENMGLQRHAITDDRGHFVIPLLPAGTYVLSARMPGFATVRVRDIQVHASMDVTVTIRLKPKGITETIDVIADQGAGSGGGTRVSGLDTSNAAAKYSVTNRQVMSLPVFANELGRNTLESLPFLVPGVTPTSTLGALPGVNVAGIAVNGSRVSSVSFNIEGGEDNDYETNQPLTGLPNPDALEEFGFVTSNYPADLGWSAGGVVNAVVKSGTTHLRGNVRYLGINDGLNARGFFDPRTPRFRLNNMGGQVGGPASIPLVHGLGERFSFFADYERTRSVEESLSSLEPPGLTERGGDFNTVYAGSLPIDPLTGKPFPGGLIPRSRTSPIAQAYLKLFVPLPNQSNNFFAQLEPIRFASDQGTARLDYKLSDHDNINLIFLASNANKQQSSYSFPIDSKQLINATSYNVIIRHTHVLNGSSVNQITGAFIRYDFSNQTISPGASGRDPSQLGFIGIHPQSSVSLGLPSVAVSGQDTSFSIQTGDGLSSVRSVVQARDDFSHSKGRNSLKFGGEFHWYRQESVQGSNNGLFDFYDFGSSVSGSGNAFADFLLGLPWLYIQTTGYSASPRQKSLQFYGNDDLHLSSDLTINLGLRYELTPPPVDRFGHVSAFRAGQQSDLFPNAPAGLIFAGDRDPVLGRLPRGLYNTDWLNFGPRIGLAYAPRSSRKWMRALIGEGKTAIRTGWGVFYDHSPLSISTRIAQAQPFATSQVLSVQDFQKSGGSFAAPFGNGPDPWPIDLSKRTFTLSPLVLTVDPAFRTPYTYQYDFIVERELRSGLMLEVSYTGANSFRTVRDRQLNVNKVGPGTNPQVPGARRIFPSLGRIISAESSGRARYDSLQILVRRSVGERFMFQASYVLSRSLDNGSTLRFGPDAASGALLPSGGSNTNLFQWARSPFDRTQNFVLSFSYDLPHPRILYAHTLLSGWRITGIIELRSGLPMDIWQSRDSTLSGSDVLGSGEPDLIGRFSRVDPRKAQTLSVNGIPRTGNFFFDPSVFRVVSVTDYKQARSGNLPRMAFDGPGFNLWSISIAKTFKISRSGQLMLRCDIKNLFNHANFDMPDVRADSGSFGQVYSAAPGRIVQLSMRYVF